jgi:hypothetical protein
MSCGGLMTLLRDRRLTWIVDDHGRIMNAVARAPIGRLVMKPRGMASSLSVLALLLDGMEKTSAEIASPTQ